MFLEQFSNFFNLNVMKKFEMYYQFVNTRKQKLIFSQTFSTKKIIKIQIQDILFETQISQKF